MMTDVVFPILFFVSALITDIAALVAKNVKHDMQLFDTLANVNLGIIAAFILFTIAVCDCKSDRNSTIVIIAVLGGILSLIFSFKLGMIYTSLTLCGFTAFAFIILSQAHFGGH